MNESTSTKTATILLDRVDEIRMQRLEEFIGSKPPRLQEKLTADYIDGFIKNGGEDLAQALKERRNMKQMGAGATAETLPAHHDRFSYSTNE